MNRVYKIIWSKVKNCYVVTSELAKRHSKGGTRIRQGICGILVTAGFLAGLLPAVTVYADYTGGLVIDGYYTNNQGRTYIIGSNILLAPG